MRIFAHAAAETQVAIKDALASKFAGTRSGTDTITQSANDPGFLEVFPRVASRPPKLLQELEAILVDRLRANDKAASVGPLGCARDRDPKLSANLSLDGHRQVLAAFVTGFSTYAPLLSRIQAEFDRALNEGVRSAQENVEMRFAMARNELAREKATAEVRGQVLAEDLSFRAVALSRLQELRDRAARAEKKKLTAEKDLREALGEQARMRSLVEQLRASNAKLVDLLAEEERWTTKPLSGQIKSLKIGPLTKEDEAFLEQELGASRLYGPDEAFLEQELGGMELTPTASSGLMHNGLSAFSSRAARSAVSSGRPSQAGNASRAAVATPPTMTQQLRPTSAASAAPSTPAGRAAAGGGGGNTAGNASNTRMGPGSRRGSATVESAHSSVHTREAAGRQRAAAKVMATAAAGHSEAAVDQAAACEPGWSDLDVAVVGGGPAGLSVALALLQVLPELRIKVFEASPAYTQQGAGVGLFANGSRALQAIDPTALVRLIGDAAFLSASYQYSYTTGERMPWREAIKHLERLDQDGWTPALLPWSSLRTALYASLPVEGVVEFGCKVVGCREPEALVEPEGQPRERPAELSAATATANADGGSPSSIGSWYTLEVQRDESVGSGREGRPAASAAGGDAQRSGGGTRITHARARFVIAADGYFSRIRRTVVGANQAPTFRGSVRWLGNISQSELDAGRVPLPAALEPSRDPDALICFHSWLDVSPDQPLRQPPLRGLIVYAVPASQTACDGVQGQDVQEGAEPGVGGNNGGGPYGEAAVGADKGAEGEKAGLGAKRDEVRLVWSLYAPVERLIEVGEQFPMPPEPEPAPEQVPPLPVTAAPMPELSPAGRASSVVERVGKEEEEEQSTAANSTGGITDGSVQTTS
ncbi:hypothetical protein VOLCADRAFT_103061 [Volvox carteri f. nagariensis]|uniref:FAD-binding domain-containing protein n=1 Tax=Volvox carteri f. nagariensis TaxID=3068 RepID=D8TJN4_VOLCA|nr:uncharacterized protein VOLCADRAFT_103061 [Volvox carteri f. nagariensis]EFJ52573.1 hypothetical protein VOLCADRAFT_103061 [Volvox carteri f. nagariensis]|eukprot:XP_002946646.1 hypothetical protein VOLCADRAFT_103061 [Volvox carteri f. nagariensis]